MSQVALPFSPSFFERYTFVEQFGAGTHGETYVMVHRRLQRKVLIWTLRPEHCSPEFLSGLERESGTLSGLTHASPRLLRIYEIAVDGGAAYIVSEYIEGLSLRAKLARTKRAPLARVLSVTAKVLSGLKELHAKNVVHGSLDPDCIWFLKEGGMKVAHLGLPQSYFLFASKHTPGSPLTYRSLQNLQGEPPSVAGDVYSAALIAYEMLAGRHAKLEAATRFEPDGPAPEFPAVRSLGAACPGELEKVLAKALHPDPKKRYITAGSFRAALRSAGEAPQSESGDSKVSKSSKRHRSKPSWKVPVGTKLNGRYELMRYITEVETGQIWHARDLAMEGTPLIVRLIPPDLARDPEAMANVRKEALVSQKLAHPNILRVITFEPGPPPFMVMEHAPGSTLDDAILDRGTRKKPPFTPEETLPILEGVAAGLQYAHDQGVIHRDVKPRNIVLLRGTDGKSVPKLVDFGLAAEVATYRTGHSSSVPPHLMDYMSPEQQACQRLDGRADVYSLAATLFHMLTLTLPFSRDRASNDAARASAPLPRGVPPAIAQVVQRGLAPKAEDRPASPSQLASAFREALKQAAAAPPAAPQRDIPMTVVQKPGDEIPSTVVMPTPLPPAPPPVPSTVGLTAAELDSYKRTRTDPPTDVGAPQGRRASNRRREAPPRRPWYASAWFPWMLILGFFGVAVLAWWRLDSKSFEDYVLRRAGRALFSKLERMAEEPPKPAGTEASPTTTSVTRKVLQVAVPAAKKIVTEIGRELEPGASPSPGGRVEAAKKLLKKAAPVGRELWARLKGDPRASAASPGSQVPDPAASSGPDALLGDAPPPPPPPVTPGTPPAPPTPGPAASAPACEFCQRYALAKGNVSPAEIAAFHEKHQAFTRGGGTPPPGVTLPTDPGVLAQLAKGSPPPRVKLPADPGALAQLAGGPPPAAGAGPRLSTEPALTPSDREIFREQQRLGNLPLDLTERQMMRIRRPLSFALAGRAKAKAELAALFEMGVGVSRDRAVALRWYRDAAKMGDLVSESKVNQLSVPEPEPTSR